MQIKVIKLIRQIKNIPILNIIFMPLNNKIQNEMYKKEISIVSITCSLIKIHWTIKFNYIQY